MLPQFAPNAFLQGVLMRARYYNSLAVLFVLLSCLTLRPTAAPRQQPATRLFNTAKLKLREGTQLVGATIFSPDPNIYCAMANAGYDYLWIEMQHSPLTYEDVAKMIWACRGSSAMPFIRVPDATEGDTKSCLWALVRCASAKNPSATRP
jgi:hypothetical protein